jgi:hypothetical protein
MLRFLGRRARGPSSGGVTALTCSGLASRRTECSQPPTVTVRLVGHEACTTTLMCTPCIAAATQVNATCGACRRPGAVSTYRRTRSLPINTPGPAGGHGPAVLPRATP